MIDDRRQRLSTLVDGEGSPTELQAALAETLLDPELEAHWERYLTIGRVLRGERLQPSGRAVAARVAARLAEEAPAGRPGPGAAPIPLRRPTRRRRPAAAGPVLGGALAAGLALVAVVVAPRCVDSGSLMGPALVEAPATLPSRFADAPEASNRWSVGEPTVASKLNELLVSHRERAGAGGLSGLIPYATVVGYGGSR